MFPSLIFTGRHLMESLFRSKLIFCFPMASKLGILSWPLMESVHTHLRNIHAFAMDNPHPNWI